MSQSRPLFCLFSYFSHYNFNKTNLKKHRWCGWDSNPWPQEGRRTQFHRAVAAVLEVCFYVNVVKMFWSKCGILAL